MNSDKYMPKVGQVATYIRENSPDNSKCVDVDFLQMKGFCLVAWVIEKAFNKNQGFYQAFAVPCEKGCFGEIKKSIPARYYDENGKRMITSSAFGIISEKKEGTLITEMDNNQVIVTLAPAGKAISQILIQDEKRQKIR